MSWKVKHLMNRQTVEAIQYDGTIGCAKVICHNMRHFYIDHLTLVERRPPHYNRPIKVPVGSWVVAQELYDEILSNEDIEACYIDTESGRCGMSEPTYEELLEALKQAMESHSKQCMGYDDCRVCQTGGYEVIDAAEAALQDEAIERLKKGAE